MKKNKTKQKTFEEEEKRSAIWKLKKVQRLLMGELCDSTTETNSTIGAHGVFTTNTSVTKYTPNYP